MKNRTKFWEFTTGRMMLMAMLAAGSILAGCATYVPIKSTRPPTIDTSNMQRLAIKDFENKSGDYGPLVAQLAHYLTDKAKQIIPASGRFTIVSPTDPNADGIFTGEIRSIKTEDSTKQRKRKDKYGNVSTKTVSASRKVSVEFIYSVISSRTDMPVGSVKKQGSIKISSLEESSLTDSLTLAKKIVDSQMRTLEQDIAPTIVSTKRKLKSETSKDKAVKQRMKTTMALVKNDNYEEAIREFDAIGNEFGSTAAKTNANILREAIASDIAVRAELIHGLTDKAVTAALGALDSKLPAGATIMIMKTNTNYTIQSMLDYVVEQVTKSIVQTGKLKLLDRSNQDLINAEQQFQLSGNVGDDTIVSIGHQLGAQYIVICWISGEKSLRRLNLRVLNIETGEVFDHADFEI